MTETNSIATTLPASPDAAMPVDQSFDKPTDTNLPGEKISEYLNRISDDIEALDREKRLQFFRKMIRSHQYFDGNFYGYVDDNCDWIPAVRGENDKWYDDNQYYPYIRTALMELSRRQTEVQISAAYKDEELEQAAKFAQERYNDNRDKTFTAHLKQTENTYAVLNGIVYRYTYFDFTEGSRREKIPKLQAQEPTAEEIRLCANCQSQVEADTPCPKCGSEYVHIVESQSQAEIVIGYEEIPTGKNKWISPNPVGIIVSMQASTVEESTFIKWKQLVQRSLLESKYPKINLPSTGTISPELRYIGNQQTTTPAEGRGISFESAEVTDTSGNELELLEDQLHWLDYSVYARKTFSEPQQLSNGKVLPAGVPLGKLYPDGLYFARVGKIIVDMWNEDKNRKWTASPYSLRAGSLYGAGTFAAHSDQEKLNDQEALKMANMWNNSVPREFVDPNVITELSADPAQVTEVNNRPQGERIVGFSYEQAPPLSLGAEVYGMSQDARGSMQNKIGALSTGGQGLADTQKWGDTATAISIRREMAVGRFAPDLELLADNLDRKQAYQFLQNEQQFFTPAQWKRAKGDYGDAALKKFLEADIHNDFTITIVPGSYMPKSESQTISRFQAFAQSVQIIAPLGNPELMAHAADVYGVPQSLVSWGTDKMQADKVILRFSLLAEKYIAQNGDIQTPDINEQQALQVATLIDKYADIPVDVFLDNHQAIMDAIKDWRGTDAGRDASNALLAALALRYQKHQIAIMKQKQLENALVLESEAPIRDKQEEEQAKQLALAGEQEEIAAQQSEEEKNLQIAGALNDKDEAQKDREFQAQQADADRQRDVVVSALESEPVAE